MLYCLQFLKEILTQAMEAECGIYNGFETYFFYIYGKKKKMANMSVWDKAFRTKYNTWKSFLEVLCGLKEGRKLETVTVNTSLNKVWKIGAEAETKPEVSS